MVEHGCGDPRGNGHYIVYQYSVDLRSGGLLGAKASQGSTPGQRFVSRCHVPDNLAVNGARDTVLKLEVHLWDGVLWEDRGVRDITYD